MPRYYVHKSAKPKIGREIHREGCLYLPEPESRIYLGDFSSCHDAVRVAQEHYARVNGCFYCANACHLSRVVPSETATQQEI